VRTLITASVAIVGWFAGLLFDMAWTLASGELHATAATWVGLAVGLVGGVLLARQTYPRRRRREFRQGPRVIDVRKR